VQGVPLTSLGTYCLHCGRQRASHTVRMGVERCADGQTFAPKPPEAYHRLHAAWRAWVESAKPTAAERGRRIRLALEETRRGNRERLRS
jgi:hypothetical protein